MTDSQKYPYADQGNRLRILRKAENIASGTAFAAKLGWAQSGYSQFETGARQVPLPKVQALPNQIPGFDAQWLWHGDKRNLGFDLRRRIDAVEESEAIEAMRLASAGAAEG